MFQTLATQPYETQPTTDAARAFFAHLDAALIGDWRGAIVETTSREDGVTVATMDAHLLHAVEHVARRKGYDVRTKNGIAVSRVIVRRRR